ncbi:hypothetical protein CR513_05610, partial [Mucuna pruriens]
MASIDRKPIKVNKNTLKVEQEIFARICVEIDLNELVVTKVWLDEHWYEVEYKDLHIICVLYHYNGQLAKN